MPTPSLSSASQTPGVAAARVAEARPASAPPRNDTTVRLHVLVVDDDDPVRRACAGMAESFGCKVHTAATAPAAQELLRETFFDVVFLDVRLPGGSGGVLLQEMRRTQPHAFVVMMSAFATVNSAVDLMRQGAGQFLQKPFALREITDVLETASQRRQGVATSRALTEKFTSGIAPGRLIGVSEGMRKLFRMMAKVAHARHPVLILGERGTGKETVARALHLNGPQPVAPFVPVDCDSLEPQRLERELFGTGDGSSDGPQPGLLAKAGDGTVYLSEVGFLEPSLQARLVRTLTERHIRTSATATSLPLRARVLASSSRDLSQLAESGRFRKDLYYRLNVVTLRVPPLRERDGDIPLLAESFLERQRQAHQRPYALSEQAMDSLLRYNWAGNVEELENLIERACGLSSDSFLHFGDMSTQVKNFVEAVPQLPETPRPGEEKQELIPIQELERRAIQEALRQLNGDKALVAKCLGIGKTTLYRKLKEYDLIEEGTGAVADTI